MKVVAHQLEPEFPTRGDRPKECRMASRVLQPCWVLDEVMEPDSPRAKGLQVFVTHKLDEPVTRLHRRRAQLRQGQFQKTGLLLNFCPFCGCDIRWPAETSESTP